MYIRKQFMVISFPDYKKPITVYEYDLEFKFRDNKVLDETIERL